MIHRVCHEGFLDEAKECLVKMEKNGCFPDDLTYNTIVREFLKRNRCYEALVLLETMVKRGFSPDASIFPLLLDIVTAKELDYSVLLMVQKLMPLGKT